METEPLNYDDLVEPKICIDLKAHLRLADYEYIDYSIEYRGKIYSSDDSDPATDDDKLYFVTVWTKRAL
jgi:hypothetical protein